VITSTISADDTTAAAAAAAGHDMINDDSQSIKSIHHRRIPPKICGRSDPPI